MSARHVGSLMMVGLAVLAVGCSKELSKSKAEEALAKRYNDKPTPVYCGLKNGLYQEKPDVYSSGPNDEKCIRQLQDVGALQQKEVCAKEYSSSGCMTWGYKLGPKGMVDKGFWIECGTKKFGHVTSVTTEGKKAKVKFTRVFKLDDTKRKLSDCILEPLADGENEGVTSFAQDDSGNWTEE